MTSDTAMTKSDTATYSSMMPTNTAANLGFS
jgi:hypothetical protein